MKKLISLIAIAAIFFAAQLQAQTFNVGRGNYGNYKPMSYFTMHTYNGQGVSKATSLDTLVNGDTGYVWCFVPSQFNLTFDVISNVISGTVATASYKLQGSMDSSTLTASWHSITGATALCTDCIGASSTTAPSGSVTHYVWQVPYNTNNFQNFRVQIIQTGTCTATYNGKATSSY